jgi:hypothetical protein
MELQGTIQNGVIVVDRPEVLREGAIVTVIVPEADAHAPTLANLLKYAGTVDDLPPDMAINHDHYLHGAPKQ